MQKILGIFIVLVQLFDVAIHIATDQVEPLRIASNLIILIWILLFFLDKLGERAKLMSLASIGSYLVFNLIFLALEGLTNPNTGGFRGALFVLVILTMALSAVLLPKEA